MQTKAASAWRVWCVDPICVFIESLHKCLGMKFWQVWRDLLILWNLLRSFIWQSGFCLLLGSRKLSISLPLFQINSNIHMHEDTGGVYSRYITSCQSHTTCHTHTLPESLIRLCVFIRINLSQCNAFRRSVLAGRWFYLQIQNTEKWNIIQSTAFFFVCWECVFDFVCV